MRGLRRHRRTTAWLAIVALLGNVLASAFATMPVEARTPVDDLLGPLVLCTAQGLVTPDDSGNGPRQHTAGKHCPACTLVPGIALLVTIAFAGPAFEPTAPSREPPSSPLAPLPQLTLGGLGSRAPPAFA